MSVIIDGVPFDESELEGINGDALSDEETKNLVELQRGWLAYKADNDVELQAVLHNGIIWHELNSDAGPGDYKGITEVMQHFRDCKAIFYNDVVRRVYEEVKQDHAVVRDILVTHHNHECLDVYRLEDNNQVIEMWTCVTHPVHDEVRFTTKAHTHP